MGVVDKMKRAVLRTPPEQPIMASWVLGCTNCEKETPIEETTLKRIMKKGERSVRVTVDFVCPHCEDSCAY